MSDTCIVCLGDLNTSSTPIPLPDAPAGDTGLDDGDAGESSAILPIQLAEQNISSPSELIAHLLPCGHNLHDECLKPWVERANSCPICRQNFNEVELCKHLNGPIISSYGVIDRTQVAEIDPSMLIEDFDEPEFPPCTRCGQDDNEEVLMLCDGCEQAYHTYCVDIDSVPLGHWFCEECSIHRAIEPVAEAPRPMRTRRIGARTRAQMRQARHRDQASSSDWARVWQAVSDRAGFDLDFPHNGNLTLASLARSQPTSRRRRAWERRLQVAERQGASNRFREGASELFDRPTVSRPRPAPPEPESLEEVLAWNAFEKARDISADPTPKTRKRKSATNSPSEPDMQRARKRRKSATASPSEPLPAPQPERRLKRPQTRRALDINNEPLPEVVGESSSSRSRSITNGHRSPEANGNVPSFLQSLLKEVETSAVPDEPNNVAGSTTLAGSEQPSPGFSSPGGSPTASNHPSPRPMSATPPPMSPRSASPAPLTSKVEPIFPLAPDLRSDSPTLAQPKANNHHRTSKSQTRVGRWALQAAASSPTRPRSEECSPTRANMSLTAKENIQRLVKNALKVPYQTQRVNKDQYTDINRSVSRMLYDKVGEDGDVLGDMNETWKRLAAEQVEKAVQSLQTTATTP